MTHKKEYVFYKVQAGEIEYLENTKPHTTWTSNPLKAMLLTRIQVHNFLWNYIKQAKVMGIPYSPYGYGLNGLKSAEATHAS